MVILPEFLISNPPSKLPSRQKKNYGQHIHPLPHYIHVLPPPYNHAQVICTRPNPCAASTLNSVGEKSKSVALHPVHLSTTVATTLTFLPVSSRTRVAHTFSPHSGFVFGFPPTWTASKTRQDTATIASVSVETMPHAPRPVP